MSGWIPITERLPEPTAYPFTEYLVWIEWPAEGEIPAGGGIRLVHAVGRYTRFDDTDLIFVDDFAFGWGGGDNYRTYPKDTGFRGEGGYGPEDGFERVTHWMPLPDPPKAPGCGCHSCIEHQGRYFAWWRCLAMNIMNAYAKKHGFTYEMQASTPIISYDCSGCGKHLEGIPYPYYCGDCLTDGDSLTD